MLQAIVALATAWRRLGRQSSYSLMELADHPTEHMENAKRAVDALKRAAAALEFVGAHLDCFELVARDRRCASAQHLPSTLHLHGAPTPLCLFRAATPPCCPLAHGDMAWHVAPLAVPTLSRGPCL